MSKREKKTKEPVLNFNKEKALRRSKQKKIDIVKNVLITAKINARLPDGKMVLKGDTIKVSKEYADRLVSEKDSRFIIGSF